MYVAIALYGITGGLVVGSVGTAIYCLFISGLRGLPGWLVVIKKKGIHGATEHYCYPQS